MERPYREASVTGFTLSESPKKGTPGENLLLLLCGLTQWLGSTPCIHQSLGGDSVYVLYRSVAFTVSDFWNTFGLTAAVVNSVWSISIYGTASNQETVKLSAVLTDKSVRFTEHSISGKSAEALATLCFQVDCKSKLTADSVTELLNKMNWRSSLGAMNWSSGDFLRQQNLLVGPVDRGFFCYAGINTEATPGDFLYSLDFESKLRLWKAFLSEGLAPLEFEWLGNEISEKSVINRMEWELALGEALDSLNFRVENGEKSFALFDGSGNRRYFGADFHRPAERVLLKILFPLNYN